MGYRTEYNFATGSARLVDTAAYLVNGQVVLIDDGQPVPAGAVPVEQAAPVVVHRQFSVLEFLDLFSEAEQLAIVGASMQSAQIKLWYDRTLAASFVTIDDARVSAGLTALVAAGLLTEQRKGEIFAAMSA